MSDRSPVLTLSREGEQVRLKGEMTHATVVDALQQSESIFSQTDALIIDLQEVRKVDSAALSLMLEWVRRGQQRHQEVAFTRLPQALHRLSRIGGVSTLLPILEQ